MISVIKDDSLGGGPELIIINIDECRTWQVYTLAGVR
jgi:hypothetical protein